MRPLGKLRTYRGVFGLRCWVAKGGLGRFRSLAVTVLGMVRAGALLRQQRSEEPLTIGAIRARNDRWLLVAPTAGLSQRESLFAAYAFSQARELSNSRPSRIARGFGGGERRQWDEPRFHRRDWE